MTVVPRDGKGIVGLSPRELVAKKSADVVSAYLDTRARWNPARSLKALTEAAAREYEDRFLVELIQNAYDAHPPATRDGRINILLATDEGDHGVLYVANDGRSFTASNFNALCEIAVSDKAPDESIGSKGVGFKSVLQVCEWPEIYSADGVDHGCFDGFCFGFSQPEDVVALVGGHREKAEWVTNDFSPYLLPKPLDAQPGAIRAFAKAGYSTVVRLPLSGEKALGTVEKQIKRLLEPEAPIMLFLERLAVLEICRSDRSYEPIVLTRSAEPLATADDSQGTRLEIVDLAGQGTWIVARRSVPEDALRSAIDRGVAEGALDSRWADWREPAVVAAAVRSDGAEAAPRMYAFLPMGEHAPAPFYGHLSAPFSTKLARTDVSDAVELNSLFLDVAAEACLHAAVALKDHPLAGVSVCVDFITWSAKQYERLGRAAQRQQRKLNELEVIPILALGDGRVWGSLGTPRVWAFDDTQAITAQAVVEAANAELVQPQLGAERIERLEEFCVSAVAEDLNADPPLLAEWVEAVAASLAKGRFSPRRWDLFYEDVEKLFRYHPEALRGRLILLDDEGRLHPCAGGDDAGSKTLVFFPAVSERNEDEDELDAAVDIRVPASLSRHLIALNEQLRWNYRDGSTNRQKPVRAFLERQRLVKRFRTRDLLEHVGGIARRTRSQRVSEDALKFAQALYRAHPSGHNVDWSSLSLRVPNADGQWILAVDAIFSASWRGSRGAQVEDLIRVAREDSKGLAALEFCLLAAPEEWPFLVRDVDVWRAFLAVIGVMDGLPLVHHAVEGPGNSIRVTSVSRRIGLSSDDSLRWDKLISATVSEAHPQHPLTPYRARHGVATIPGQEDYETFGEVARVAFAAAILESLERWPSEAMEVSFFRPRHHNQPDERVWPSPALAFLELAEWVPIARAAEPGRVSFAAPAEVWLDDSSDVVPLSVPVVVPRLRKLLVGSPVRLEKTRKLGVRVWGARDDAASLIVYLGQLSAAGKVPAVDTSAVMHAYRKAWADVVATGRDPWDGQTSQHSLAVIRAGGFIATPLTAEGQQVYIIGRARGVQASLLDALGQPEIPVEDQDVAAVTELLERYMGPRVADARRVRLKVLVDGREADPQAEPVRLIAPGLEWLAELIGVILDLKSGRFDHRGAAGLRAALARLRRIRIIRGEEVKVAADGRDVALGPPYEEIIPLDANEAPALIVRTRNTSLDWGLLEEASPAIAELINAASAADAFRATFLHLQNSSSGGAIAPPTDEVLARALGTAALEVHRSRESLRSVADIAAERVIPLVQYYLGTSAALELLAAVAGGASPLIMAGFLTQHADRFPRDPEDLVRLCGESSSLDDVRADLEIPFADFNRALAALPPPYVPRRNVEGHEQEFEWFKRQKRIDITQALRSRFLSRFDAKQPLDDYVEARGMAELIPDPAWVDICELPTPTMMEVRLEEWLQQFPSQCEDGMLASLDEVRDVNTRSARETADRCAVVIAAWCASNNVERPPLWSRPRAESAQLAVEALDDTGVLDFRALSETDVIQRMAEVSPWPIGMPITHSAADLGLDDAALAEHASEEEAAKRQRALERRSITLDGRTFLADTDSLPAIIELAREGISQTFLRTSPRISSLAEQKRAASRTRGTRQSSPYRWEARASETQRAAIGFLGELAAYEWLRFHYSESVSPDSWKSSYRAQVFATPPGNDGLGYDFEVVLQTKTILFEVKATPTDVMEIELGETEVAAAQRYATGRRHEYKILFLMNVLESDARTIHVLPNPFSPAYRESFRLLGTGLRYRFELGARV